MEKIHSLQSEQSDKNRLNDHLNWYVQQCKGGYSVASGALRFRSGDIKDKVKDLIRAAIKNLPQSTGILAWFDRLSVKDFLNLFPHGAAPNDASRKDYIVESFSRAHELCREMDRDLYTRMRVGFLTQIRGILGDRPSLMPKELVGFAKFRETDLPMDIRKLAMKSCDAAASNCGNDEELEKLLDLGVRLFVVSDFERIAEIAGLDKRHKKALERGI